MSSGKPLLSGIRKGDAAGNSRLRRRPRLEVQAQRAIRKHQMTRPGECVLVAVSGGADSTALLLCLRRLAPTLGVTLAAAHLNHCIRGAESDADEDFVRRLCAELQVPLISQSSDVRKRAQAGRKNLEEAARDERYAFLRKAALETGAQKVALGHNLNDQAETVLMRLLRGSGLEGLASIRPILDDLFIRPFIESSRRQITEYLRSQGASYREDSTNRDLHYGRNRVRLELIPYLEKHFNPRVVGTLALNAAAAREVSGYLSAQARLSLDKLLIYGQDKLSLSVDGLRQHHPALQRLILRMVLRELRGSLSGIGARHIEDLLGLCRSGKSGRRLELASKILVVRQFDRLEFLRGGIPGNSGFSYMLEVPGECAVHEAGLVLRAKVVSRQDLPERLDSCLARTCLDADSLPSTLVVRSRLPGDRYGGPTGRKVKKMLIDARIPLLSRGTLPMLVARETVVWIPGFRASRAHTVRAESRRCLVLEIRPLESLQARL